MQVTGKIYRGLILHCIFVGNERRMIMRKPQVLIGAATSGSGKTTFTLGLLRLLRNRGMKVQSFKCGPDYIDTKHHAMAAGEEAVNLDTFMASSGHVRQIYTRYGAECDACVTEGVMGLFDGYDKMKGSSAEIAGLLGIPVVLVLNAKSTAYSVAPVLYGFMHFHPELRVIGAIFNFVASESHYAYLRSACEDVGIEALGYIPKDERIVIPSRHLGLSIDKGFCFDEFADTVAEVIAKTVNVDRLLELCTVDFPVHEGQEEVRQGNKKIAVARDEAFNFMYRENLEALKREGEVVFFSPLRDTVLPSADLIYLPGGYPELFLPGLSGNEGMRQALRAYCEAGGRLLAECGGMMYLCESITGTDGIAYPMVGVLGQEATMESMKLKLGYREVVFGDRTIRGHEFHYSRVKLGKTEITNEGKVYNAKGGEVDTPIFRYKNVIASYVHFYWGECGVSCLFP